MTTTESQLKLQAALLEIEQLKNQLKQTEGAVQKQKHAAELKQQDWRAELDAEVEKRAEAIVAQNAVLEADKAARGKASVYTRPANMTEYRSLTTADRAKVLGLFGGESLVRELAEKESRENAAYRTEQRLRGRF